MSVVLRMARHGSKKRAYYRIVAATKDKKRDGRFLEVIGTFNPRTTPSSFVLKEDKVKKWIEHGALPSGAVRDMIRKQLPGYIEEREKHQLSKIQNRRKKRKSKAAGKKARK